MMTLIDPEWIKKHQNDVSMEQIKRQGIVLSVDGRELPPVQFKKTGCKVKFLLSTYKGQGGAG